MSDKMGRPTDERKETRITLRLTGELLDLLNEEAEENGISLSEVVRGKITNLGYVRQNENCVRQNSEEGDSFVRQNSEQKEIASMCGFYDLSEEEFYRQIYGYFQNGEITVENRRVVMKPEEMLDTKEFEEACEEKDLDPQEQINKFTKMIWNMRTGGAGGA